MKKDYCEHCAFLVKGENGRWECDSMLHGAKEKTAVPVANIAKCMEMGASEDKHTRFTEKRKDAKCHS